MVQRLYNVLLACMVIAGVNVQMAANAAKGQSLPHAPLAGRETSPHVPVAYYTTIPADVFPALTTLTEAQRAKIIRLLNSLEQDVNAVYTSQTVSPEEKQSQPDSLKSAAEQAIASVLTPPQRADIAQRWPIARDLHASNTVYYATLPLLKLTTSQWNQIAESIDKAPHHAVRHRLSAHEYYGYYMAVRLKTLALLTPEQRAIATDPQNAGVEPMPPPPQRMSVAHRVKEAVQKEATQKEVVQSGAASPQGKPIGPNRVRGARNPAVSPSSILTRRGALYPLLIFPYGRSDPRFSDGRNRAGTKNPIMRLDAPGLLVILVPPGEIRPEAQFFWQGEGQIGLHGDYYVLLYPVEKELAATETLKIPHQPDTAALAASIAIAAQITELVQRVCADYPVRSERIFLAGTGSTGQQGYVCALAPETPFQGFYFWNMPFLDSALPPLRHARGRRFLLRQHGASPEPPFVSISTVQKLLQQQGAMVKLEGAEETAETSSKTLLHNVLPWLEKT